MKKVLAIFKTVLLTAVMVLSLASCEKKKPLSVIVYNFVATIAENQSYPTILGQVKYSPTNDNGHARFYFTGSEELNNHISLDEHSGSIEITNPAYFDYEQRTQVSANAAITVYDDKGKEVTEYFTITINITDIPEGVPTLTTEVTNITSDEANFRGTITSDGNNAITETGFVWSSTNPAPTISDLKYTPYEVNSPFYGGANNLTSNTIYYARSYATNSFGTGYGNVVTFKTLLKVGDAHEGGIVAYILKQGDGGYEANVQHGIIAATADQSSSAPWALTLTTTGATDKAIGTGQANTNAIVANQGAGTYAAKICADLVLGGYDDWYLPSMNELIKLYENQNKIGGFALAFYWSSSEENTNTAWLQSFNSSSQTAGVKTDSTNPDLHVRAVRSF